MLLDKAVDIVCAGEKNELLQDRKKYIEEKTNWKRKRARQYTHVLAN